MIVVAIVGVLAALAIYGVQRYIANAKTAEAKNSLGQISKDAQSAYAREHMDNAAPLAPGGTAQVANLLCPDGPPVPKDIPSAEKVQSDPDKEWIDGWKCLRFSMSEPQYYRYTYDSEQSGADGTFTALAEGDLDGDTIPSEFKIEAKLTAGNLFVSPTIAEKDPEE